MSAAATVREGDLLWRPSEAFASRSQIARYLAWLRERQLCDAQTYDELWHWSVTEPKAFWASIWQYFEVMSSTPYRDVLIGEDMQRTRWFPGSQVNYAEHVLRHEAALAERTALWYRAEATSLQRLSWSELGSQVRRLATQLRALGVQPGDRVVAYLPNAPQTAVAMLATAAVGAVWSSSATEFGSKSVIDRFAQIAPKVLFAVDGYRFGGKAFERQTEVREIVAALPSLEHVIWLRQLDPAAALPDLPGILDWQQALSGPEIARDRFRYERVAHDHPLWVLFSSGTTGLPKAIVHGHVGVLVEHLKLMHFHLNLDPDSVMFFHSTAGWMMWNLLIAALLTGSAAVLYDGSPVFTGPGFLWELAEQSGATCFGASPTFVQMMEKAGLVPAGQYRLERLESIVISGAPSTPETFDWFYRCVKRDLWVTSQSGGTEICSGFVGACPLLPVYAGEIQTRMLGMDVHAFDDAGREVRDVVGELVVTSPFPSMPLYFWNDAGGVRYHESYFDTFPDVWRHGDFLRINDRGGCYIYGRSDSTLNRHGVRIGTAEVYRCVEQIDAVVDSLIVCCELPGGRWFMPMFVRLKPGSVLDQDLRETINDRLRRDCSPRHVPDEIIAVDAIPYTLTGKKMEIPVRKLLTGATVRDCVNAGAMSNPASIDWYVEFRNRHPILGTIVR